MHLQMNKPNNQASERQCIRQWSSLWFSKSECLGIGKLLCWKGKKAPQLRTCPILIAQLWNNSHFIAFIELNILIPLLSRFDPWLLCCGGWKFSQGNQAFCLTTPQPRGISTQFWRYLFVGSRPKIPPIYTSIQPASTEIFNQITPPNHNSLKSENFVEMSHAKPLVPFLTSAPSSAKPTSETLNAKIAVWGFTPISVCCILCNGYTMILQNWI